MKNKRDMEISIEVTHDCSCKCRMCSSDAWHPSPIKNELTTQEVYSILLEGTEIGANILSLSGGEPSVRDDVFEIIDIAKNMGYKKILYYTSGTQFDEDENVVPLKESTMEKLAEYKATVIFDFQNCDEKKENWLFDIDDYFKMRESVVKRLVEMGVRTEGHFVPMTVNYSNIFPTCEYASELGIKRMSFLRHVVQGRSRQNLGLMISPKQFADMQWIFLSLIDEKIIDVRLGHPIDFTPLYDSSRKWETCRGGHDAPLIKPNGDVDMCFSGDTKIIVKTKRNNRSCRSDIKISSVRVQSFASLWKVRKKIKDYEVLYDGKFIPIEEIVHVENQDFYEIELNNGVKIKTTPNHIHLTREGEKRTVELQVGDYLPFSLRGYEGIGGDYDLGRFVGLYIAEGSSFGVWTFGSHEKEYIDFVVNFGLKRLGSKAHVKRIDKMNTTYVSFGSDSAVSGLLRSFISGERFDTKRLKEKCFNQSIKFREGLLQGVYEGDKDRTNEIGLANPELIMQLSYVSASIGRPYSVRVGVRNFKDGRKNNKLRGGLVRFSDNPNEKSKLRGKNGRYAYPYWDDFAWCRVNKITKVKSPKNEKGKYVGSVPRTGYCLITPTHKFELANGLLTHNCPAWKNLPYVAGNLREKSLKEIWYESKYYKAFREFSENKHKDAVGFCADCPYLSKCKMGCTAQRLIWSLHPDDIKEAMLYGVDPMCPYYNGFAL